MYNTIFLFDTSIATENLGDFIIMDAVKKQLRGIFKDDFFVSTATHDTLGKSAKEWYHSAEYSFVGGTNLLTDRFIGRNRSQWKYGFRDMQVSNSIGVGLGWQSYKNYDRLMERPLKWAQKKIYRSALSHTYMHSVRDSYTKRKLSQLGIDSINTACVTMWNLTPDFLSTIPERKSDTVVTTITNYCKSPEHLHVYRELLSILLDSYEHVKLWIQAGEDYEVFQSLALPNAERIELVSPNLPALDRVLDGDVDYIGTRLHAGIRALQHQNRTMIIELDNRSHEIARDTNLPTLSFKKIDQVIDFIEHPQTMDIQIPLDNIAQWKAQFK